jgi:hypothetical protein
MTSPAQPIFAILVHDAPRRTAKPLVGATEVC